MTHRKGRPLIYTILAQDGKVGFDASPCKRVRWGNAEEVGRSATIATARMARGIMEAFIVTRRRTYLKLKGLERRAEQI